LPGDIRLVADLDTRAVITRATELDLGAHNGAPRRVSAIAGKCRHLHDGSGMPFDMPARTKLA